MADFVAKRLKTARRRKRRARTRAEVDAELQDLKARKVDIAKRWHIDAKAYRAPFYSNGEPGPALDLRPFFAQYHLETKAINDSDTARLPIGPSPGTAIDANGDTEYVERTRCCRQFGVGSSPTSKP
jgi:hypothetical protein